MTSVQPLTSPESTNPAPRSLRNASIAGVGAYLPEGIITNSDLEAMVETSDTWIMERTGIRHRHQAASGETVSQMGATAARQAMTMAGVDSVDAIVFATSSPDTLMPAAACFLQRELGLDGVPAFDINAACSGFVYAMQVGTSLVQSGAATTVLVVAAEAMTRLIDFGDRSTCILFGDGAGAVVLAASDNPGIRAIRWGADGSQADIIYYGPKQDDENSTDALRMAGRSTYRLAIDRLCGMAEELAEECGWGVHEVQHFIPHQANLRIIEASAKRLGVTMDRVIVNVEEVGNTSAASIALALVGAVESGRIKRGDKLIAIAFGAGATWGGVAFEWTR